MIEVYIEQPHCNCTEKRIEEDEEYILLMKKYNFDYKKIINIIKETYDKLSLLDDDIYILSSDEKHILYIGQKTIDIYKNIKHDTYTSQKRIYTFYYKVYKLKNIFADGIKIEDSTLNDRLHIVYNDDELVKLYDSLYDAAVIKYKEETLISYKGKIDKDGTGYILLLKMKLDDLIIDIISLVGFKVYEPFKDRFKIAIK